MKHEVLALLVAVLVIGGLGVAYSYYSLQNPLGTTTLGTAYSASNPNLGIRLIISLNASTIHVGGTVNYTASVYNARPAENNVSSASNWAIPRLISTPCGPTDSPIAYAIIQGHYISDNISKAPSVNYGMMCTTVMGGVGYYSFQPNSDIASVYGSCLPPPCDTIPISTWRPFSQHPSGNGAGFYWTNFTTGVYTIVAEDEWGDVALASFTVK